MPRPALILAGHGVGDSLQLTVESQRAIARASRLFVVSPPPAVERFLRGQRLKPIDLASVCRPGSYAEWYLDMAGTVLREVELNPPVALLVPGNPLLSNALVRFLVAKAKELRIQTSVLPAVSPIDTLICQVGLDVGTYGLQVFDARRLCERRLPISPAVPLLLLQVGGLAAGETPGAEAAGNFGPLAGYLARYYPPEHPIVHLANDAASPAAAARLAAFPQLAAQFGPASTLFVDRLRQGASQTRGE